MPLGPEVGVLGRVPAPLGAGGGILLGMDTAHGGSGCHDMLLPRVTAEGGDRHATHITGCLLSSTRGRAADTCHVGFP